MTAKVYSLKNLQGQALSNWELWWDNYPKKRKVAKLDAIKAWKQTEYLHPPIEQMLAILDKHRDSNEWQKDGGAFIPYPATYLRGGRFLDEI